MHHLFNSSVSPFSFYIQNDLVFFGDGVSADGKSANGASRIQNKTWAETMTSFAIAFCISHVLKGVCLSLSCSIVAGILYALAELILSSLYGSSYEGSTWIHIISTALSICCHPCIISHLYT